MKILFTTESYYPIIDGGAIAQHRIVHELIKKGHDVRVIAPGFRFQNYQEKDNESIIYRSRGLQLPFYMNNKYHFTPFPLFYVKKIINTFKPDIIDVCSPYPTSLSALIMAKQQKIPLIGSIHILPENILAPFINSWNYKWLQKQTWNYLIWFYNRVDWATAPTQTGADIYQSKGLKTQVTPISNGVDTTLFKPENNGEYLKEKINLPHSKIVLYCGRINQEKNLDVLINAIPLVVKETQAHFLFCGSGGYKKEIQNLTKQLNIADHTTFIEFLDWKDYPNIYSLADVFTIPAEAELQSIVTLEAVASGLPIVAVNKGAVPELANAGNGYVFDPGNSKQLADSIIRILNNKELHQQMRKNSIKLAQQHSLETIGSQYEQVYRNVIQLYEKI